MIDTLYEWTRKREVLSDDGDWVSDPDNADEVIYCPPDWAEAKIEEARSGSIWNTCGAEASVDERPDGSVEVVLLNPTHDIRVTETFEPIAFEPDEDEEHEDLLSEVENMRAIWHRRIEHDDGTIATVLQLKDYDSDEEGYLELETGHWVARPEEFDE